MWLTEVLKDTIIRSAYKKKSRCLCCVTCRHTTRSIGWKRCNMTGVSSCNSARVRQHFGNILDMPRSTVNRSEVLHWSATVLNSIFDQSKSKTFQMVYQSNAAIGNTVMHGRLYQWKTPKWGLKIVFFLELRISKVPMHWISVADTSQRPHKLWVRVAFWRLFRTSMILTDFKFY